MGKSLLGHECWRGVLEGRATLSLDACPWLGVCLKQRGTERSPSKREPALRSSQRALSPGGSASVLSCPHLPLSPSPGLMLWSWLPGLALALSGFTLLSLR